MVEISLARDAILGGGYMSISGTPVGNVQYGFVPVEGSAIRHEFGTKPQSGPKDRFGDRSCQHWSIKGNLIAAGSARIGKRSGTTYPAILSGSNTLCYIPYSNAPTPTMSDLQTGSERSLTDMSFSGYIRIIGESKITYTLTSTGFTVAVQIQLYLSVFGGYKSESVLQTVTAGSSGSASLSFSVQCKQGSGSNWNIPVTLRAWFARYRGLPHSSYYLGLVSKQVLLSQADIASKFVRSSDVLHSKLSVEIMNKLKMLDINTLAYTKDLINLPSEMIDLVKSLKKIKDPKTWASLWLNYRYGLRLFIQDTTELLHNLKKRARSPSDFYVARASESDTGLGDYTGSSVFHRCQAKIYVRRISDSEKTLDVILREADLYPSLVNIWDFIPYSFVLDWVVPIGELLASYDAEQDWERFPILGALISDKLSVNVVLQGYLFGTLTTNHYFRRQQTVRQMQRRTFNLRKYELGSGIFNIKHGIDSITMAYQRHR